MFRPMSPRFLPASRFLLAKNFLPTLFLATPFLATLFLATLFSATGVSIAAVEGADKLSDLKPGTKVIVDVGGESVGEVIERVAPDVYRVRVKIQAGVVIEPALPVTSLRLAPAAAVLGPQATRPGAAPAAGAAPSATARAGATTAGTVTGGTVTGGTVTGGTATPGTVTPGTVTPGTVTPGTVTPGTAGPGTITPGTVQGTVKVTPGTVRPGSVTAGTVTPGTVTQGTTAPAAIAVQTVTPGTVTPGTVTPGTVVSGTATAGVATAGAVAATPGTATTGAVATGGAAATGSEVPLVETPAGAAELRSLAGVWNVASMWRGGRPVPSAPQTVTITPTSITLGQLVYDRVRVDPTSTPRRIDLTKVGIDRPVRAIYRREGDRLWICVMPGEPSIRPTDFQTAENDGRILYECDLTTASFR